MKTLLALAVVALVALTALAVQTTPAWPPPAGPQIMADLRQDAMLDAHRPMMSQMRTAATPGMPSRMPGDPMRRMTAAELRLMEQEQAQLDRLVGRG